MPERNVKFVVLEKLYQSDEFLIKDNHIASSNLRQLILLAIKNKKGKKITVEVDNLKQLKEIIGLKFNTVLFDNMSIKNLRAGVKLIKKYYQTEASGNINLKNVKSVRSHSQAISLCQK